MSPIANMLLVILLDLGVDVLMSEKKTSSVVEDVRLILTDRKQPPNKGVNMIMISSVLHYRRKS